MNDEGDDEQEQPQAPCDEVPSDEVSDDDAIRVDGESVVWTGNVSVGNSSVSVRAMANVISTTVVVGSIRFDCALSDWTEFNSGVVIKALAMKAGVNESDIVITDLIEGSTIVTYKIIVQSVGSEDSEDIKGEVQTQAHQITQAIVNSLQNDFADFLETLGMLPVPILSYVPPSITFEGASPFACRATTLWADTDPSTAVKFNLYKSQYEGNDRAGTASAAEYDVTDCACQCSGSNPQCGLSGSLSYYSGVDSAQACALMLCHSNEFSQCLWQSEVVATGRWFNDAIKFYSTVLRSEEGPPDRIVVVSTSSGRNITRNLTSSAEGLLDSFPTPTPTPDHSLEQIVNLKSLGIMGQLRDKACLATTSEFVSSLLAELRAFNQSSLRPVTCVFHISDIINDQNGAMSTYDNVDNALAGYDQNSPLANDPTRHATLSMNDLSSNLLQSVPSPGDVDTWRMAFDQVVGLLAGRVPPEIQCVSREWPLRDVLLEALGLDVACDMITMIADNSTLAFYDAMVSQLEDLVGASPPPQVDNGDEMNPGLFNPAEVDQETFDNVVENGMMGSNVDLSDCDEQNANGDLNLAANALQVLDTEGRAPGSRLPVAVPVLPVDEMPSFGSVRLDFKPREGSVATVSQPAQTDNV